MPNTSTAKNTSAPRFMPLSIARMIWNRKLLIILSSVVLIAGAAFITRRLPNIYRAETVIFR